MEINPKKLTCVIVSDEILKEINKEELEENLNCKLILQTPSSYYDTCTLVFYSNEFEEVEIQENWFIVCNEKIDSERTFEWRK